MPSVHRFLQGSSNPGDGASPADPTPTTDCAPARCSTQEPVNAVEGRFADAAKDPAEDAADATDATDADLLDVLSKDHPTTANLEQDDPIEAQTLARVASIEPAPTPPRYPIQPEIDSSGAAPEVFAKRFPLGNAGTPLPGVDRQSTMYESSRVAFGASTWALFHSQCDWEIAHWAKMRGPSSSAMEELLAIPEVCAYN